MGAQLGGNVFQQAQTGLTQGMGAQQLAGAGAVQGMGFQPMAVQGTSYTPATAQATGYQAAMGDQRIGNYMNPYISGVIGNLGQEMGRSMQMGSNQLGAAASKAGAFGGSRHGIAQGQMMGDAMRGFGNTAGNLLAQGFGTALGASQADAQRINQARQFGAGAANQMALANQSARNQAGQFGAAQQMAAQQANQQAQLAGAQQRLAAGSQLAGYGTNLANLGQMGFGMGRQLNQDALMQGALQRQIQQGVIDAAKQQYAGFQGQPERTLGMTTAALGAAPVPQSQTQSRQLGLMDYLTFGATAGGLGGFGVA